MAARFLAVFALGLLLWAPGAMGDDVDGDHVADDGDLCPEVADAGQEDLDGDGEGDACDGDLDGDGVGNAEDACPRTPDPEQGDRDADAVGDACDVTDDAACPEACPAAAPRLAPSWGPRPDMASPAQRPLGVWLPELVELVGCFVALSGCVLLLGVVKPR